MPARTCPIKAMNKPAVIIIFLILIAMLLFLFVIPEYQEYQSLRLSVIEKQAKYSGESIYFARISDIILGLQSRQQVLDKIKSALPASVTLGPMVDFLQKKGSENGVSITSIVFSQALALVPGEVLETSSPAETKDVLFTMDLTGSYQGLKNFLFAMDNSARLFEMDSVSFSLSQPLVGVKNRAQEYTMKLEVRTRSY